MALGISEAVELARTVTELVKKGVTIELQERVMELREAVLNARDETLALRDENQQLRGKIQAESDWAARAARYELVRTRGGAMVYRSPGPPEHYACPACLEAQKQIQVLQGQADYPVADCPSCKARYIIEVRR